MLRFDALVLRVGPVNPRQASAGARAAANSPSSRVDAPSLLVAVCHVQLGHLVNALLVLSLDVQLELELVQHPRDLGGRQRCVRLDEV